MFFIYWLFEKKSNYKTYLKKDIEIIFLFKHKLFEKIYSCNYLNSLTIGGRQSADIVNWLKKKTGPPTTPLSGEEALNKAKDANEVAVVGYFAVS